MKLATIVYIRNKSQTLMMHRIKKDGDMHQGKWNGLGGKFEEGETPEQCAVREVNEECGLTISNPTLKGVLTFPNNVDKSNEAWYCFVFLATEFSGNLIDSDEGNLKWIDNDKLLNLPLWEGDHKFLPLLDKPGVFSGRFVYKDGKLIEHDLRVYD